MQSHGENGLLASNQESRLWRKCTELHTCLSRPNSLIVLESHLKWLYSLNSHKFLTILSWLKAARQLLLTPIPTLIRCTIHNSNSMIKVFQSTDTPKIMWNRRNSSRHLKFTQLRMQPEMPGDDSRNSCNRQTSVILMISRLVKGMLCNLQIKANYHN